MQKQARALTGHLHNATLLFKKKIGILLIMLHYASVYIIEKKKYFIFLLKPEGKYLNPVFNFILVVLTVHYLKNFLLYCHTVVYCFTSDLRERGGATR